MVVLKELLVHYYHDVLVEDNNATIYNGQNDAFSDVLVDLHIFEVYNLKDHVYS
jgi:hypothetical protein